MWPNLSTPARLALDESHGMTSRMTIYSPTFGVLEVPIADGTVEQDATSMVRRTATVQADPRFWPRSPFDLLSPFGAEATIEYGIVLRSGGIEWVPCGRFSLDKSSRKRPQTGSAEVNVNLVDRSARVADDRFEAPVQTVPAALTTIEIRRLIHATLGTTLPFVDLTGSTQVAAQIELPRERWEGIEKLADSIAAEVFFDRDGIPTVRPQPTLNDPVVWQVRTGDSGNILTVEDTLDRAGVYNRVIVTGAPGIRVVVSDYDLRSHTRFGGPFGKKPRNYSNPLLTTTQQATAAGAALLARSRGAGVLIAHETLVNPALDPGDVVASVDTDGVLRLHILDKVPIPLSPKGTQTLTSRSDDLPPEQ